MQDMGISHLHFDTRSEALINIPNEFPDTVREFSRLAKFKVESLFDEILEVS